MARMPGYSPNGDTAALYPRASRGPVPPIEAGMGGPAGQPPPGLPAGPNGPMALDDSNPMVRQSIVAALRAKMGGMKAR